MAYPRDLFMDNYKILVLCPIKRLIYGGLSTRAHKFHQDTYSHCLSVPVRRLVLASGASHGLARSWL